MPLAAAFILLLVYSPKSADAGTNQLFQEYGVSPRDSAMGNAFTALADDYSAAFYNPAGFALVEGHNLHFGYRGIYPETYINLKPSAGRNLGSSPSSDLFLLGISSDLDFRNMFNSRVTDRFGIGLALAISKYMKSFTLYSNPDVPYMFRYSDRPVSLLGLYFGFGVKIFDWVSLGGSLCAAPSQAYTDVIARTTIYVPSFRNETHQGMSTRAWTTVKPVIGTMFIIPGFGRKDFLHLAAVWHDEVITIDGSGEVTAVTRIEFEETGEVLQVPMTTFALHQLSGYSPMSITLAACLNPTANIHLTADGIWRRWSKWLDGDENLPTPRFNDTYHARFGYEHLTTIEWSWIRDLIVRAGYYYEPSPVEDMNGRMNILDPDKHVGSVGLGFLFSDPTGIVLTPVVFDLAYQLHWLVETSLDNDQDPVFPPLVAGGQVHSFATTLQLSF